MRTGEWLQNLRRELAKRTQDRQETIEQLGLAVRTRYLNRWVRLPRSDAFGNLGYYWVLPGITDVVHYDASLAFYARHYVIQTPNRDGSSDFTPICIANDQCSTMFKVDGLDELPTPSQDEEWIAMLTLMVAGAGEP